MLRIRDIPEGAIVWLGDTVIGIKGSTLPETFNDCTCFKVGGNDLDYELFEQEFTEEQSAFIKEAEDDWNFDED